MKNTLFRRAVAGTFAAAAAVGLSTLFVTPASAHAVLASGAADCQAGQYTITWTVHNDYGTPVHISKISASPSGSHADIDLKAYGTEKFTTTYVGTTKNDVQLTGYSLWKDGNKTWPTDGPLKFVSDPVHLKGDCKPPTTPPTTPTTTPPTTPPATTPPATTPTPSASSTPGLPVTGSSNTLPLAGTGAALVAGGAVLVVTLRRRRRVTFTAE